MHVYSKEQPITFRGMYHATAPDAIVYIQLLVPKRADLVSLLYYSSGHAPILTTKVSSDMESKCIGEVSPSILRTQKLSVLEGYFFSCITSIQPRKRLAVSMTTSTGAMEKNL